ncbi:hypothetical protein [Gemella sanguinis]|jgi:hypothetical protein|uniref:hypothetical protein n=1 Tax=Gemella sanguinis TaxID=84135 RepID=UPI0004E24BEF|nr:hypothetical protein [Gemella sanguinis]NKZ26701.1 hypothetical protein [Gemella sanguinis]
MLSRIFKVILLLFLVAPVIVIMYDTLAAPKVLTRENNKGNEFEQLDRLMNTTRYAEQVRKAGYEVDDYDLKMMDRIPALETLGKNKLSIESPTNKSIHIFTEENHNLIIFSKDMTITGSVINQGEDKPSRKLTEEEKTKYEREIKEEINKLLDDVYKAGKE